MKNKICGKMSEPEEESESSEREQFSRIIQKARGRGKPEEGEPEIPNGVPEGEGTDSSE